MNKKSQRLEPIKDIAANTEIRAAQALASAQQMLLQEQAKLTELQGFRHEYVQRFSEAGKFGMNGSQLQQYQSFIVQLDKAIGMQRLRIDEVSVQCDQARSLWQQKHNRTQALDKTVQKMQSQERYQEERKQQREIEDTLQSRNHFKK